MDPPVQVGIAGASWAIAGSFARSLLPRSPIQQAVASGVVGAIHYQLAATSWAFLQASAALPGQRPGLRANLTVAGAGIAGGLAVSSVAGPKRNTSLVAATAATAGRITAFAGLAGGAAAAWDAVLHRRIGAKPGLATTLLPPIATGAAVVAASLVSRNRRAAQYGIVDPQRRAVTNVTLQTGLRAAGVGVASGLGFATLTSAEQLAARGLETGIEKVLGRSPGALGTLAAHGAILGSMALAAGVALGSITSRIHHRDDVVEPAYPSPPTSPFVSAGSRSSMPFSSLGKEGRRFVLMALTSTEISDVMGAEALDPVRVVGGYESADDIDERAALTLADMEACGAFQRSLICVGSPTGVGYFNYSLAEAIEYLTLGDCAIVVPQYALVPSALALDKTHDAERLTRAVLSGIRDRIAAQPSSQRSRVVLAGESLGANVALDVAVDSVGLARLPILDALGVHAGLYLGVPFRTRLWQQWQRDPDTVDRDGRLMLVSEPSQASPIDSLTHRHLMVVHDDDPVNKFGYRMVLQPPWWMRDPATRPPRVPRETKFRPITTFVLATVDLLNGMQSRPGAFVRVGHDYRIDLRLGVERAFGLSCSATQADAIEAALRQREQRWATRRMIARKLDRARRSIERQLAEWGTTDIEVADLDPTGASATTPWARLSALSAPPGA